MGRRLDDQEYRDDRVLGDLAAGGFGSASIPGLRFVVPPECLPPSSSSGNDKLLPGVYFRGLKSGSSPTALPSHAQRRLTKSEALEWAGYIDEFAQSVERAGGRADDWSPPSYGVLVAMFYEALGRRLDRAIEAASDRRSSLREVRAALTGRVGS